METTSLYVLKCPETGEIRYAGKANSPSARLQGHIRDSKRYGRPVCRWVHTLIKRGLVPVMEVIEVIDLDKWQEAEIALIARLRASGARMLNLADGGEQPSMSIEQRIKNAVSMNRKRDATPQSKRLHEMKRQMSIYLRTAEKNDAYERIVAKLRLAASKNPRLFGKWAAL